MSGADASTPEVLERVVAPLVNSNEPEAQVVELHGEAGSRVEAGAVVCTLETSKSTVEVEVGVAGFLGPFAVRLDDRISAGDLVVEILSGPPAEGAPPPTGSPAGGPAPRLTKKAAARVEELGLDLAVLPTDRILTERDVTAFAPDAPGAPLEELPAGLASRIHGESVVILGAGGLGKSILEVIRREGRLDPIGFVDDGVSAGREVLGLPVLGGRGVLAALAEAGVPHGVNAIGGIGRMRHRVQMREAIGSAGIGSVTIVDPSAQIAESARLEDGVHVMPAAVVWSSCVVGRDTLVNSGAIVSHDCIVGPDVHLAPGATLAGEVTVGEATLVGMGVTTRVGARIGARAIVGNGAVVADDVPDEAIVPAGSVWPSP